MDHPAQRRQRRVGRALSRLHLAPIRAGRRRPSCAGASKRRCGTTVATTPRCWPGSRTNRRSRPRAVRAGAARCSRAATAPMPSVWCASAWRNDRCPADTESARARMFGALLTPGDHKARMDRCSTATSTRPRMRAAKRLGGNQSRSPRRASRPTRRPSNAKALLDAVPSELHSDPGYIFSRIQLLRRDDKFAEAAQLMLSAPQDPGPPAQSRRMVDRAAAAGAQAARRRRAPHRLSDRARRRAARARHLQDRAGIHRRLDRAALPERSGDRRAAFRAHRRRQRQSDRAGARRLLAGPRRRSRRPRPGGARAYQPAAEQSTSYYGQLARAKLGLPQIELNGAAGRPRRAASNGWRSCARCSCSTRSTSANLRMPILADLGENGDPTRWSGLANCVAPQRRPRHAAARQGRAQSRPAVRSLRLSGHRHSAVQADRARGRAQHRLAIARQESAFNPKVVSPAQAYGLMQVTPDAGTLRLPSGTAPPSTSTG